MQAFEFNIVYTPGTVRYLSPFVWSLLRWSNASFRLVANGCSNAELKHLKWLCAQHERLEYWAIPTEQMLPHGTALNYLQAMTSSRHFCFMDSDILATAPFLGTLGATATECAAVCSGAPLWLLPGDEVFPASFEGLSGEYSRTANGLCLGSTYVAVFDNAVLRERMQELALGFEAREWHQVSPDIQTQLRGWGLSGRRFDTGKVLMLALQGEHRVLYVDEPALCHIGGTSFEAIYRQWPSRNRRWRERLTQWSRWTDGARLLERVAFRRGVRAQRRRLPEHEARILVERRQRQRNPARSYLYTVLQAAIAQQAIPPRPDTGLPQLDERLEHATAAIEDLYAELGAAGKLHAT